jgi:citrate lyase subunit beta/citryl-CoA lyase
MRLHEEKDLPVWRSMLFVPVNVPKFVDKAHTRGADAIILDLEDSVPPDQKAAARGMIANAKVQVALGGSDVVVRINRPLELAVRDVEEAIQPGIAALMLTKIDSASHVRLLAELADSVEAAKGLPHGTTRFIVLVESVEAFNRVEEIAAAHPRNVAISLGSEDFALDVGGEPAPDMLLYPKQRTALAAIQAGILPMGVIGSIADYSDHDAYRAAVAQSRRFGFRGSSCVHPSLVPILNEGFGPTAKELAWARRVKDVYEQARKQGRASIQLDGKMVDIPIVVRAERLLAMDARIAARAARRA